MKRYLIIFFFSSLVLPVFAQKDSVWKKDLKEITIASERVQLYNIGSRTDKPDSLLHQFYKSSPIAALLEASSGLVIRSYGPGILATSSIRGGNSQQTALTWNGMSINSPVNGLTDLNLVPSYLFDGISVLPGLAGSLQGSGAISGGINLNNALLKQKGFSAEAMQTVGSFGMLSGGLKIYFTHNKWSHATKIFYSKTKNNYPFNNPAEVGNPKQNLTNAECKTFSVLHETGYQSSKAETFKISYWGNFAERQIPPTLFMQSTTAIQFDNIHKTMFQWDKAFKKFNLKFRSVLQKDYLRYNEAEMDINSISKSYFITNDAELRFKLFKNSGTSTGLVQTFAKARVANVLILETSNYNQSQRNQIAIWASHFHQFPSIRTRISGGIRQEMVDGKFLPFIPSVGFKTNLHNNWDVYGQTSRVYRIPTLNDLHWFPGGNPKLKPESGWAFELTTEFHKKTIRLDFTSSLTGFSRLINNWIQWQPLTVVIWSPVNIGNVNSRGLELRNTLKIRISKKFYCKTGFNFDYTISENRDSKNKNYLKQLIYIPYFKSSGFLILGYKNTVFMIQGIWVGKRYITSDNMDSIPGYTLLNLALNQNLKFEKTSCNVFLRVNNILDKRYEAIAWRPMPGINFEMGVSFKVD